MTYEEFVKKIEEPPVVDLKLISGDEFRKIKYLGEAVDKPWHKFELQDGRTMYVPISSIACMI